MTDLIERLRHRWTSSDEIQLHIGECTAQELRSVKAVAISILSELSPELSRLQSALQVAEDSRSNLLGIITAIREASGLGAKPMLGELAEAVGGIVARAEKAEKERDEAVKALEYAAMGLDRIHNSLMRNGPKQASGEMTMHFRDSARETLSHLREETK